MALCAWTRACRPLPHPCMCAPPPASLAGHAPMNTHGISLERAGNAQQAGARGDAAAAAGRAGGARGAHTRAWGALRRGSQSFFLVPNKLSRPSAHRGRRVGWASLVTQHLFPSPAVAALHPGPRCLPLRSPPPPPPQLTASLLEHVQTPGPALLVLLIAHARCRGRAGNGGAGRVTGHAHASSTLRERGLGLGRQAMKRVRMVVHTQAPPPHPRAALIPRGPTL